MKVLIKETGKLETLSLKESGTNIDYTQDFIGNSGALTDGQFTLDDETGHYVCTQATFNWWANAIEEQIELAERIEDLEEEYGVEAVQEIVNNVDFNDLEDQAKATHKALDDAFGVVIE